LVTSWNDKLQLGESDDCKRELAMPLHYAAGAA
jgi:hypothetical protein